MSHLTDVERRRFAMNSLIARFPVGCDIRTQPIAEYAVDDSTSPENVSYRQARR